MSNTREQLENTRRRLAWRASRRGIKEMDILVGGYADAKLSTMTEQELSLFESLLDIPDQQLLSWVTLQEQVPAELTSPMLLDLLAFRPARYSP
jgi:antitoxin CptB